MMELPTNGSKDGEQVQYWDSFYRLQNGRVTEWYSGWTDLQGYLTMLVPKNAKSQSQILVAGCGNSELSAHMYDAGWPKIINVDFSKVVIAEMLRLHVRSRPLMRWQVMDMTNLQFADACFDVVLDKGSLDSLAGGPTECSLVAARSYLSEWHENPDPQVSLPRLGLSRTIFNSKFKSRLSLEDFFEVKRVLRPGGKYVCVTVAQSNVLELLLETFRQGWLLNVHTIPPVSNTSYLQRQPYLVYAIKSSTEDLVAVKCFFENSQNTSAGSQVRKQTYPLPEEVAEENKRL